MRFASLFAGIGGIDLGLELAGFECVAQVEVDGGCQKVLSHHWPAARLFGDIRKVSAHDLGSIEGLAGGFPCQDISGANPKGQGLAGERSGLWSEFRRLVEESSPRWVLVENVHARWRRWVPTVRADLAALGFRSEVFRLRAADFGAWHERARAFVIAAHPDRQRQLQPQGGFAYERGQSRHCCEQARIPSDTLGQRRQREGFQRPSEAGQGCGWSAEPYVARVVHGLSRRVDQSARRARERALGNSVVPACSEWCGWKIREICYG